MAYRATSRKPAKSKDTADDTAIIIKRRIADIIPRLQAGKGDSLDVIDRIATTLRVAKSELASIRMVPGIGQYAKDQEDDPTYDVIAEFTAMETGIADVIAWVANNFPQDGNGYMLERKMNADGTFVPRVFTSTQIAPLITRLQALSALII